MPYFIPMLAIFLGLACFDKDGDDTAGDGGDGGGDDGGDDGGGGDGGDGGDGGSDGGDGGGIDCDDPPAGAAIGGPDCVTDSLACGDSIIDNTEGGGFDWEGDAYQGWYCLISTATDYGGPERVYAFDHPGTGNVTFSLSSPCADLDLVALHWSDEDTCPLAEYSVLECEGDDGSGTNSFTIWNNEAARYLVIVDGDDSAGAPFQLSVSCE